MKCQIYSHLGLGNWDTGARQARRVAFAPSCPGPFKGHCGPREEVEMVGGQGRVGWGCSEGVGRGRVVIREGNREEIRG